MGLFKEIGKWWGGTPEKRKNLPTYLPEQEGLANQLFQAGQGQGAGGAFGDAADYYRGLMSGEGAQDFINPMLREYNQDIVPGLSEQFAGMGSGGLSSSGFRNAQIQGATDLADRIGSLRANLRHSGASGLAGIGQLGLQNFSQNQTTQQGSPGFASQIGPLVGTAAGAYFGGPAGAAAGNQLGQAFSGGISGNKVGMNSSPYGQNGPQASPQKGGFQMPNFQYGQGGF